MKEVKTAFKERAKSGALGIGVTTGALVLASTPAHAALDVGTLVTEISGNSQSVQTIMLAVLTIAALFVGFMFIKRAMR